MKLTNPWHHFRQQWKLVKDSEHPIALEKTIHLKPLVVAFLPIAFALMPLATPAHAAKNNYEECAESLRDLNISPSEVAKSCSQSLYPQNLASCVVDISKETDVLASDALNTCSRVRRPLELASCVVDISDVGTASDAPEILDLCRRSLLPVNFSQCVLGLVNQTDLGITDALRFCIDGSDRGRNSNLT
jgi:hypothetical protein